MTKLTIAALMGTLMLGSPVLSLACKKGDKGESAEKSDTKRDSKDSKKT